MRMKLTKFPQEIIEEYKLKDIVNKNGWVYLDIHTVSRIEISKRLNKGAHNRNTRKST